MWIIHIIFLICGPMCRDVKLVKAWNVTFSGKWCGWSTSLFIRLAPVQTHVQEATLHKSKHDGKSWESITYVTATTTTDDNHYVYEIQHLQLKTLTSALGVIRNMSHSTPYNCQMLHETGMTACLASRIRFSSNFHHQGRHYHHRHHHYPCLMLQSHGEKHVIALLDLCWTLPKSARMQQLFVLKTMILFGSWLIVGVDIAKI